jgi:hypothetical protein
MANQTGIFISINAWLPTGKGLDEQFQALSLVKAAHESGDYAPLLAAAKIEAVKTESKTRRMEVEVPAETHEQLQDRIAAGNPLLTPAPVDKPELEAGELLPNPVKKKQAA